MIRLMIPEASPTANDFAYSHWRVRHASKQRWATMLLVESRRVGAAAAAGKRKLTIERHGRQKLDIDNLIGGAKGLIDCLRALKLLRDDGPEWLELAALNVKLAKGEQPHTVLVLEDL